MNAEAAISLSGAQVDNFLTGQLADQLGSVRQSSLSPTPSP